MPFAGNRRTAISCPDADTATKGLISPLRRQKQGRMSRHLDKFVSRTTALLARFDALWANNMKIVAWPCSPIKSSFSIVSTRLLMSLGDDRLTGKNMCVTAFDRRINKVSGQDCIASECCLRRLTHHLWEAILNRPEEQTEGHTSIIGMYSRPGNADCSENRITRASSEV